VTGRGDAVVLLSGGLDSATAATWAIREGFRVHGLSFDYGQRHAIELRFAAELARRLQLASHRVLPVPLGLIGGSALTDLAQALPVDPPDPTSIPSTYVPARNLVFLSLAVAWAETIGARDLVIGANAVDWSGYPDCREPFLQAFARAADEGTRTGAEGGRWQVHAPLVHWTKAEIIAHGTAWGVPWDWTTSCYGPDADGRPCGRCESCTIRAAGFAAAGVTDPLPERLGP
jgi:7-cyano-7-deazaguanine synthase